MRFLKVDPDGKVIVTKDLSKAPGPYAILSHTWSQDGDEIDYNDLCSDVRQDQPGFTKLWFCINQARRDSLEYVWVDTCCINKANHSELSKAIISMFRWYQDSAKCYVYLSDVSVNAEDATAGGPRHWEATFKKSRWFRRGWTLQELLAPPSVEFFSAEGNILGNKQTLENLIHETTRIPVAALRGLSLSAFSIAERLSWTEGRETTELEDKAYCLLGIFSIFLPLLYGEGDNATRRLREAIGSTVDLSHSHIHQAYHGGRLRSDRLAVQCSSTRNRWSNVCIVDHREVDTSILTKQASIKNAEERQLLANSMGDGNSEVVLADVGLESKLDPASNWILVWGGEDSRKPVVGKNMMHDFHREGVWSTLCDRILWQPLERSELTDTERHNMNNLIRIYHKSWDGNNWGPFNHVPQDWNNLQPIVSVSWSLSQLNIFRIGPDKQMHHKWYNGTKWGPSHKEWEDLGGRFDSPPTATSWGLDRIDLFGLGTDHQMYHKWWDGSSWCPSIHGWEGLGGILNSPVSAISWGPNRLDIFGLGTDDKMYHKWWSGSAWCPSYHGWECLGGQFTGSPALASWGSHRLSIFALGTDDMIHHKMWNGMHWNPPEHTWQKLEDVIKSAN